MKYSLNLFVLIFYHIIFVDAGGEFEAISSTKCSATFSSRTTNYGIIQSPNYPIQYLPNLICEYNFIARKDERVVIEVLDMDLEDREIISVLKNSEHHDQELWELRFKSGDELLDDHRMQCFYDYLDIYDVDELGHQHLHKRLCGKHKNMKLTSYESSFLILFVTDRLFQNKGFKIKYYFTNLEIFPLFSNRICGPIEILGNGGLLASPHFPNYIHNRIECAWKIRVDAGKKILVRFTALKLSEIAEISNFKIWNHEVHESPDFVLNSAKVNLNKTEFLSEGNEIIVQFQGIQIDVFSLSSFENLNVEMVDKLNRTLRRRKDERYYDFFSIAWTAVRISQKCNATEFKCSGVKWCEERDPKNCAGKKDKFYCIQNSQMCDSMPNCRVGDDSDESNCSKTARNNHLYLIIVFVIILLSLTFMGLAATWFAKAFRSHRKRNALKRVSIGNVEIINFDETKSVESFKKACESRQTAV